MFLLSKFKHYLQIRNNLHSIVKILVFAKDCKNSLKKFVSFKCRFNKFAFFINYRSSHLFSK
jgi:hypothetical protein